MASGHHSPSGFTKRALVLITASATLVLLFIAIAALLARGVLVATVE